MSSWNLYFDMMTAKFMLPRKYAATPPTRQSTTISHSGEPDEPFAISIGMSPF